MAKRQQQLTLFQCSGGSEKRAKRTENVIRDGTETLSDSDDESDVLKQTRQSPGTFSRQQTNTIQIDKPVGATTIIINAESEKSSTELTQMPLSGPLSDLAFHLQISIFPPLFFLIKVEVSILNGIRNSTGLEYSISRDAAFCYPFTSGGGKAESTFTVTGFRDWKHASGTCKSGTSQG